MADDPSLWRLGPFSERLNWNGSSGTFRSRWSCTGGAVTARQALRPPPPTVSGRALADRVPRCGPVPCQRGVSRSWCLWPMSLPRADPGGRVLDGGNDPVAACVRRVAGVRGPTVAAPENSRQGWLPQALWTACGLLWTTRLECIDDGMLLRKLVDGRRMHSPATALPRGESAGLGVSGGAGRPASARGIGRRPGGRDCGVGIVGWALMHSECGYLGFVLIPGPWAGRMGGIGGVGYRARGPGVGAPRHGSAGHGSDVAVRRRAPGPGAGDARTGGVRPSVDGPDGHTL